MLILASNSPRRKELITDYITSDFLVIPANIDETYDDSTSIEENVSRIAKEKGASIYKDHPLDIVISADTIVVLDNKILGKPHNKEEAKNMLLKLSDKEHMVITAYHIFKDKAVISRLVKSIVKFKPLSLDFINRYIATGSPLDKAGAYGVQDKLMKEEIEYYKGSLSNIIGLPIEELKKDLEGLNI